MAICAACRQPLSEPLPDAAPFECPACRSFILGSCCDLEYFNELGSARLFHGREPDLHRSVTVFVHENPAPEVLAGLERAVAASRELGSHPRLVTAHAAGSQGRSAYLICGEFSGRGLDELLLGKHHQPLPQVIALLRDLASALALTTERGVVHRDLRPGTVLVAPDNSVQLVDFSQAIVPGLPTLPFRPMLSSSLLGSATFQAPEQAENSRQVTWTADVYSLGCLAYYCLTKKPPFGVANSQTLAQRHAESPRPSAREGRDEVSPELSALVEQMMAVDPMSRPAPTRLVAEFERLLADLEEPLLDAIVFDDAPPVVGEEVTEEIATLPASAVVSSSSALPETATARHSPPRRQDTPPRRAPEPTRSTDPSPRSAPWSDPVIPEFPQTFVVESAPPAPAPEPAFTASTTSSTTLPPAGKRRAKSGRWMNALLAVGAVALVAVGGAWYWFKVASQATPDDIWLRIVEQYHDQKWTRAKKEFTAFAEKHPDSPHVAEVPYFAAMCDAGGDIFSATGNPKRGWERAQQVFKEHRDNAAYKEYCGDFYQGLTKLIEHFLSQATQEPITPERAERIADARAVFDLLSTVSQAVTKEGIAEQTAQAAATIDAAERQVRVALVRLEVEELLKQAANPETRNVDALYAQDARKLKEFPELASDAKLNTLREQAQMSEAAHVRLQREDPLDQPAEEAAAPSPYGLGAPVVTVWKNHITGAARTNRPQVVLALADGMLYALDEKGNLLWVHRLGIDSYRVPQKIGRNAEGLMALLAVRTEDNSLLAIDEASGRVLWRYAVGQDISAPPLLVSIPDEDDPNEPPRVRALLPTSDGEIHVLEPVLGRRIARIATGQPMTVAGTYDPATEMAYFPADSKRLFAINVRAIDETDETICESVLFSDHASGALRDGPLVVGGYLITTETSTLDQTQLRAFELTKGDFARPRTAPLRAAALTGWSWFRPLTSPDRILFMTDSGQLGAWGVNLDNRHEAIFPLIEDQSTSLTMHPERALVVYANEHLVWVIAGGELRKLAVDIIGQKLRPLPYGKGLRGLPLHEAQVDPRGETFYLTTMAAGGYGHQVSAVDAQSGRLLWQRQLGIKVVGDPIVTKDQVWLVDATARVARVPHPASESSTVTTTLIEPAASQGIRHRANEGELWRLRDDQQRTYLASADNQRQVLAIRLLETVNADGAKSDGDWTELHLPGPIQGRPAIMGAVLVVPCRDGHLYRVPLDGSKRNTRNEIDYHWASGKSAEDIAEMAVEVASIDDHTVLLIDDHRHLRLLQLVTERQVTQWQSIGKPFNSNEPLVDSPRWVPGQGALIATTSGKVSLRDASNLSKELRHWSLGGPIATAPAIYGSRAIAVVDRDKLVAFDLVDAADNNLRWTTEPFKGRICGTPVQREQALLVADDSRRVTAVDLKSGKAIWTQRMPVQVGPDAAAVPFGVDQVLVPLTDGTMISLSVPEPSAGQESAQ
ncbi:MAG: PQQ-binding-like beta-propeller repeat protein [Planctomycetes bacterium]|nr:PQQ-binding-like beta-propeller repeat protein [Planctomycetota bacterium]